MIIAKKSIPRYLIMSNGVKKTILSLIKIYQLFFSPDHGVWRRPGCGCRFYPSCSVYSYQAVEKFGVLKGLKKVISRVLRCHPFSAGGFDPINH